MRLNEKDRKYIAMRKNFLKERRQLIYERCKINKKLREINIAMEAWDRALITL